MHARAYPASRCGFPQPIEQQREYRGSSVPVGHYTRFEVHPTCGLATAEHMIGQYDDPRFFFEPERMHAQDSLVRAEASSNIGFRITCCPARRWRKSRFRSRSARKRQAFRPIGRRTFIFTSMIHCSAMWTSPGDSGEGRGILTPSWWAVNQYGWLKVIRVTDSGTFIDGQRLSAVTIKDIVMTRNDWTLRLAVPEDAAHVGGLTLYGEGFGNYNHDILFRTYRDVSGGTVV